MAAARCLRSGTLLGSPESRPWLPITRVHRPRRARIKRRRASRHEDGTESRRARCYLYSIATPVKKTRRRGYTRLSPKNQVTVPADAVARVGLRPGDELKVDVDEEGRIVLTPVSDALARKLQALEELIGSATGVYEPGYLEKLRSEWR
jgi:AbrB family looped-hinge helix DNA binding protein